MFIKCLCNKFLSTPIDDPDACIAQDSESRVGCETLLKGNQVILAGGITTKAKLDYEWIVRDTVHRIGYRTAQDDPVFNSESLSVTNLICKQSPDIALGVEENKGEYNICLHIYSKDSLTQQA